MCDVSETYLYDETVSSTLNSSITVIFFGKDASLVYLFSFFYIIIIESHITIMSYLNL